MSDSEDSIDLENLPEDQVERFELLGIDQDIIACGDEMLLRGIEESAIDDLRKRQEERRKLRAEKEKAKKAAAAAERAERLCQTNLLVSAAQTKLIKFEVTTTEAKLFAEDSSSNFLVQEVLRNRVKADCAAEDFEFSAQTMQIIDEIHQRFQTLPLEQLKLPENEPFLDDFEITKESIRGEDLDSFRQKVTSVVFADSRLFFKLIISQGYDLHLTRAVLPTHDLSHCGPIRHLCRKTTLLRQVLTLIEKHYCKEGHIAASLAPSMLRIRSLTPELSSLEG